LQGNGTADAHIGALLPTHRTGRTAEGHEHPNRTSSGTGVGGSCQSDYRERVLHALNQAYQNEEKEVTHELPLHELSIPETDLPRQL